ncbi:MAG: ATP phosphoribosyltransferase regulatory subunit, partial [Candidatus Aenigmatarchaeota archaeon]
IGFKDFKIRISNRKLTEAVLESMGVPKQKMLDVFRSIDKRGKITDEEMKKELKEKGIDAKIIEKIFSFIRMYGGPELLEKIKEKFGAIPGLDELEALFKLTKQYSINKWLVLDMSLVRGLDYYTGLVYEISIGDKKISAGGGGRYDNLIKSLGGPELPATGISLGISRLFGVAEELGMLKDRPPAKIFVAPVNDDVRSEALKIVRQLRGKGVACEIDLLNRKLTKQLEYVASLNIPFVIFIGPDELKKNSVKLRDMVSGKERLVDVKDITELITRLMSATI